MEENSPSYFAPAEASLSVLKPVKQKCSHPAVQLGVELESDEISTGLGQRKEQEKLNPYEAQHLKLMFSNNMINGPIYTGRPIGEDMGNTLYLDLVDCRTGNIVTYGAEASAKVEIVAFEKDEFKIATSWPDGKSLIRGNPQLSLKDGRVSVSHISFKHTRVHMKKRELRLGARVVYSCNTENIIIQPAVTQPLVLVDRRSMRKNKRSLNLDDQVWKLSNIGKGGHHHQVLTNNNIKTVKDFLAHYFLNREYLLNILGRRMNAKKLDEAVNQAKGKVELKRYVYPRENPRVELTEVGELIGVKLYDEGQFVPVEQLTQTQKDFGRELVQKAFQDDHQNFNVLLDDDSSQMIFSFRAPNKTSDHLDGSNNGFTSEAYNFPTETKQLQSEPHNDMQSTSSMLNNYDYISQINSSSTTPTGDDNINQLLNESWDYILNRNCFVG